MEGRELLERDDELRALDGLVGDAAGGRGGALVLAGSAGIGKTALVREVLTRGRAAGLRSLAVRPDELDAAVPFGVVRDLLTAELVGLRAEPGGPLVQRALDVLGALDRAARPPARADADADADVNVLHGLYWLVATLADREPLLLAVDDAHWADAASLRFLGYLARRLDGLPVALVVATRRGEAGATAGPLAQLAAGAHESVLRPAPLTSVASTAIVRRRLPGAAVPDELCAACHDATAGNPLALHELLTALRDAELAPAAASPAVVRRLGGRAVAHSVAQRLDRVSEGAAGLACAVAVVGDIGGPEAAGALVDMAPAVSRAAAAELAEAELLRGASTVEFLHPLLREAVRDGVPAERRDALARAAARALAERGDDVAAARQLLGVRPARDPWVTDVLLRATSVSVERGAPDVAAMLAQRAAAEPPSPAWQAQVLTELGRAQLALGEPAAEASLTEAMAHATDLHQRARIAEDLAQSLMNVVRVGDAAAVLRTASDGLRAAATGARDVALADELELRMLLYAVWDPTLRPLVLERLAGGAAAAPEGTFAQRMALMLQAVEAVAAGRPVAEGAALAERAVVDDTLITRAPSIALIGAVLLEACGRFPQARRLLERVIAHSRAHGALPLLRASIGLRGQIALAEGDVLVAETDAWAMQELLAEGELGAPYLIAVLCECLIEQGRATEAAAQLEQAGLTGPLPDLAPLNAILWSRGRVRAAQGEPHAALDDLLLCGARQAGIGQRNPALVAWRGTAATVLAGLGRHEEAVALSDEEVALARDFGAPHALAAALRVRAGVAGPVPDLVRLREARGLAADSGARLAHAWVLHDIAVALAAGEDRQGAREAFAQSAALARELSASALADAATAGLVAAGGRPRRVPARGAEALTPAERRVAELAAAGDTNRRIAQALFVTEKTIETHLRHCYRKLAVGSRAQLAAALRAPVPAAGTGAAAARA